MATQPDFWGDLNLEEIRTPVSILRAQAALLGQKTQNLVEAEVNTFTSEGKFFHSFNLVAPALQDYTYRLFRVRHGIELYPITVLLPAPEKMLKSEDEFMVFVREILSSEQTRRIISSLLAQVKD